MLSFDDFIALVRDELGLPVTESDADRHFDDLTGWDSVHLLTLATLLERRTRSRLYLPDVLAVDNLHALYTLPQGT